MYLRAQPLLAVKNKDAQRLMSLYPVSPSEPGNTESVTPVLISSVPFENGGEISHDPHIALVDDKGMFLVVPLKLSRLFERKEDTVRKLAYTRGFLLMVFATLLLVTSAALR
jgi:hypothetical protein